MKAKKDTYKKTFSYVTYKKNYPRTLDKFANRNMLITIAYDKKIKKAYKFECISSSLELSKDERIVYDPELANFMLCNTNAICDAIDGVFEYKKYAPIIKTFVKNLEEKRTVRGKEEIVNDFFQKDEKVIKRALKTELELSLFKIFTNTTISKIYNSIKNRIRFKLIYCNQNGQYDDYASSQLNEFGLCSSTPPHLMEYSGIHELIKQYFNIYKQYSWMAYLHRDFEYYLNTKMDGTSLAANDPITIEWREQYKFLLKMNIFQLLYESIEFFYYYMSPFYDDNYIPINLLKKNKQTYIKNFRAYMKEHVTESSLKSIDILYMAHIYKILMEEIPQKDWENIFFIMNLWPNWYGKVKPKMSNKEIELKQKPDEAVKVTNNRRPIPF